MSATYLGYFIVALLIGCGTPVQAGINSLLGKTLGHPLLAAATNTTVATLAILIVIILVRVKLPSMKVAMAAPWCCLLYTSPSPRDVNRSRMPSSA